MTAGFEQASSNADPIPATAGIGLRGPYHGEFIDRRPPVAWLEAHSENYFAEDGIARGALRRIRRDYPVSLHGVGLSIGSTDPLDKEHLGRLSALVGSIEPALVSEHLSWGAVGGRHLNDLLPLPYTEEALEHMVRRVQEVQDTLKRPILIENVSSYLEFVDSAMPEHEFLAEVSRRSGCGLLLDINNIHVNAVNHGFDPVAYVDAIPPERVAEMHLAGHTARRCGERDILIDTHNTPVCGPVWALFRHAVARFGPRPTLIEWDSDFPPLQRLLREAETARSILDEAHALAA